MASLTGIGPAVAATEIAQYTHNEQVATNYPDKTIKELIPTTQSELDELQKRQIDNIEKTTKLLNEQFNKDAPMSEIIASWNAVASSTQVFGSKMYVTSGQKVLPSAAIASAQEAVTDSYNQHIQSPQLKNAFIAYAKRQTDLTPYERHYLYSIALGYDETDIADKLKTQDMEDFQTYESDAPIKTLPEDGSFGTLSGNIIFMPDNYTYYFGGIQPWTERLDGVANKMLESNKPFIAAQEVFDEKSAQALVDKLKGKYRYFYFNQGANYFGLNNPDDKGIKAENLGINSGLFIASQYKVANHRFIPYQIEGMQWQVKKGFDVTELESDGKVFARIITSHLQPFNSDAGREIRAKEMQAIVDYINDNPIDVPTFVLGDQNIVFGERTFDGKTVNEYADSPIPGNFTDLGNKNVTAVTQGNYTCSDNYEDAIYGKAPSAPYIYDYVLLHNGDEDKVVDPAVKIVPMHNLNDPTEQPLSDHHMLDMETKIVR